MAQTAGTGGIPRNEREEAGLRKVFICSPFSPQSKMREKKVKEMDRNIQMAQKACRYAALKGFIPYAPHLFFTQFLDDGEKDEREYGQLMGLTWLARCDELWVIGGRISEGMKKEIAQAKEWHIPIKIFLLMPDDRTRVFDADFLTEDELLKPSAKTEKEDAMDKNSENMTMEELEKAMDQDAKRIGLTIAELYRTVTMAMGSLPNMELHTKLISLSVTDCGITVRVGPDCRGCDEHDATDDNADDNADNDDYEEDDMDDFDFGEDEGGIDDEF